MEKEIYKVGEEYVEARIIESLSDLLLALALWKRIHWELRRKSFQCSEGAVECLHSN